MHKLGDLDLKEGDWVEVEWKFYRFTKVVDDTDYSCDDVKSGKRVWFGPHTPVTRALRTDYQIANNNVDQPVLVFEDVPLKNVVPAGVPAMSEVPISPQLLQAFKETLLLMVQDPAIKKAMAYLEKK